jgi:phage shock protein PspC (stress-responsive transcriptional regulator)
MSASQSNLFTREDTMLGVCQGIGEDFGFSANWLRIAFAVGLFFSPIGTILAYLGLGVVVLAARLIAPVPRPAKAEAPAEPATARAAETGEELAIAA